MNGMLNEATIRLGVFICILLLMLLWEWRRPFRQRKLQHKQRWPANISIVVIDTLLVRLLIPAGAVGAALWADNQGFGILNEFATPEWLAVVIAVLVLDLAIYWQHRIFHQVPWLWRIHRVHHVDLDLDVTTGFRFHPVEILLSMLIKIAIVLALGAPALAVILFEIILNGTSLFNHSNVQLPRVLEKPLRYLLVTPGMHRIHHSQRVPETNSNYGFNLSCWDRLFRSYTQVSKDGEHGIQIGIKEFQDARQTNTLMSMLKLPFLKQAERRR